MNNSECAKKVLDWAVREAITASIEYASSDCELSSNLAASKTWKEHNPDAGGGFGRNPYEENTDYIIKKKERCAQKNKEAHEVLEFVKNRICNLIEEK